MNRLTHLRLHPNREGPHPHGSPEHKEALGYQVQREELEKASGVQQGKGYRIRGADLQEGAGDCPLLWAGQVGSFIRAPRGSVAEGDKRDRGEGCCFRFHPNDMKRDWLRP